MKSFYIYLILLFVPVQKCDKVVEYIKENANNNIELNAEISKNLSTELTTPVPTSSERITKNEASDNSQFSTNKEDKRMYNTHEIIMNSFIDDEDMYVRKNKIYNKEGNGDNFDGSGSGDEEYSGDHNEFVHEEDGSGTGKDDNGNTDNGTKGTTYHGFVSPTILTYDNDDENYSNVTEVIYDNGYTHRTLFDDSKHNGSSTSDNKNNSNTTPTFENGSVATLSTGNHGKNSSSTVFVYDNDDEDGLIEMENGSGSGSGYGPNTHITFTDNSKYDELTTNTRTDNPVIIFYNNDDEDGLIETENGSGSGSGDGFIHVTPFVDFHSDNTNQHLLNKDDEDFILVSGSGDDFITVDKRYQSPDEDIGSGSGDGETSSREWLMNTPGTTSEHYLQNNFNSNDLQDSFDDIDVYIDIK